jgi:hypothetical protein
MNENNLFLVTSAVATEFGNGDRLTETIGTLESIRKAIDAKIWLLDASPLPWDTKPVEGIVDRFLPIFDVTCQNIVESGYGMSFVKSATECHLMRRALKDIMPNQYDRIYKISGRYRLTGHFTPHDGRNFTFLRPRPTGLSVEQCETNGMIMTRLYSFSGNLTDVASHVIEQISDYIWRVYSRGGVTDIEHGYFKYLPRHHAWFVDHIGVAGRIGHLISEVSE